MKGGFLDKANLNIIRYANCWEDADNLLQGLQCKPGNKIISIASAGDNSFALLLTQPEILVAVDISKEQLYLTELKKIAVQNLEYEEFLSFTGVTENRNRSDIFYKIKNQLSNETRSFWEQHIYIIHEGIINCGKFERYFQKFRKYILPLIHSQTTVKKLLQTKNATQQIEFYNTHWNTWRWRFLFKIFFSRYVMGKFGRDPEFLKQVDITVGDFIFNKAEKHLQNVDCQENYFLRKIFTGEFGKELPVYLRKENYNTIKENVLSLRLFHGYLQDAFAAFGKFHHMNLSNIFEYMPEDFFSDIAHTIYKNAESQATLAYWNLMVTRKLSDLSPEKFKYLQASCELYEEDFGFFYRDFICEVVL